MSQHDMDVANGAGVVVRADINAALQALASSSSGSSAPSPSFPCQLWADTGTSRLKRRNLANSAWLDEGPLDAELRDAASQGEFISDTGAANAYVCNFVPALTVRSESTPLRFKVANANTTASTINDGIGTVSLVGAAHAALQGGELIANGIAWVQWNASVGGGSYVLLFCTGAPQQVADATKRKHAVTAGQIVQQTLVAFTTGGTAGALTLTPSPAISAYAAPLRYRVKFSQASTGTDTINVSAIGAKSIKQYDSTGAKVAAVFAANQLADVEYDGVDFVLLDQLPSIADFLNTPRINVASAATVNLTTSAPDTRNIAITGAINIAGVTVAAGRLYFVTFLGALTLINSATLVTQSGMNITTAPGDTCILRATAANTVEVLCYTPGIPQAIGYLQTTQNMASARFVATDYTNTSGRPILLSVYASVAASNVLSLLVNGAVVAQNTINNSAPGANSTLTFVILPGQVYRVNSVVGLAMWTEIRV
ncbi:hypothetical protein GCM10008969_45360 [Pseudomonas veronii subsp. inensis]|uniref:hypothetical protein n=1 Tax=Pseudomonas veronii TaxID=76761 RepID=UPI0031F869EB